MEDEFSDFLSELARDSEWNRQLQAQGLGHSNPDMAKLFQHTTAALQKLSPGPFPPANFWPETGSTSAQADGAPGNMGHLPDDFAFPQLQKLTSLESLAFSSLLAAAEDEAFEGITFPWELTATASAMVSLPSSVQVPKHGLETEVKGEQQELPSLETPSSKVTADMVPIDSPAPMEIKEESYDAQEPNAAFPTYGEEDTHYQQPEKCPRQARTRRRRVAPPKWQSAYTVSDDMPEQASPIPTEPLAGHAVKEASGSPQPKRAGRKRLQVDHITMESLQEQGLFDVPIQTAAQELGVGLSVLKRICRQIGLARWPFRTRQSLRGVIAKTEQYLGGDDAVETQKAAVVQVLEQTLNGLQGEAGQRLSDSVRRYRQSVFKLNYKIKKGGGRAAAAARTGQPPCIPQTAAAKMAAASERLQADHPEASM